MVRRKFGPNTKSSTAGWFCLVATNSKESWVLLMVVVGVVVPVNKVLQQYTKTRPEMRAAIRPQLKFSLVTGFGSPQPVYGINLDISVVWSLSKILMDVESISMYLSPIILIFFPFDF